MPPWLPSRRSFSQIVGLQPVKDYILSLEDNFKIQQLRRERGLKADSPSMHMIFTGNPGTGKTTVARIVSRYLKAIGVLQGGQLVEVTRADLVGQYVGHTAPLTQKAIQSALGGVLFIDEAYSLYRGKDDSFGLEAIDTLVKGMEDHRATSLSSWRATPGKWRSSSRQLRAASRFPNIIEFPDYTARELCGDHQEHRAGEGLPSGALLRGAAAAYYKSSSAAGTPAPTATAAWPATRWRRRSSPVPGGTSAPRKSSGIWNCCCRRTLACKRLSIRKRHNPASKKDIPVLPGCPFCVPLAGGIRAYSFSSTFTISPINMRCRSLSYHFSKRPLSRKQPSSKSWRYSLRQRKTSRACS